MTFSYKPLFKLLLDNELTKTEMREELGLSSATLAKMGKGEYVSMEVLDKICERFDVQPNDVIKYVDGEEDMIKVMIFKVDPDQRARGGVGRERIITLRLPLTEDMDFTEIISIMRRNKKGTRIIFDFNQKQVKEVFMPIDVNTMDDSVIEHTLNSAIKKITS